MNDPYLHQLEVVICMLRDNVRNNKARLPGFLALATPDELGTLELNIISLQAYLVGLRETVHAARK